jgi:hypothetical protein
MFEIIAGLLFESANSHYGHAVEQKALCMLSEMREIAQRSHTDPGTDSPVAC